MLFQRVVGVVFLLAAAACSVFGWVPELFMHGWDEGVIRWHHVGRYPFAIWMMVGTAAFGGAGLFLLLRRSSER